MDIALSALREGLNNFRFETTALALGFEENTEENLFFSEKIITAVDVQKLSEKYFIKAIISTTAHFICDRCLDDLREKLTGSFALYFSKDAKDNVDDDSIRLLAKDATEIDLTSDAKENLLLALPMKKICHEDCLGLCSHCGANLNKETCN